MLYTSRAAGGVRRSPERGNVQRSEQHIREQSTTHQHSTAGPLREPHRHDDRVLRLLHLRDRRRHRLSAAVLSGVRSRVGHARLARDLRDRLHGPADRLGALRPLRRPRRPQDDARRRAADDGHLDGADWRAADLRRRSASPRRSCSRSAGSARASASAASGAAPCCSRSRTRRRASAPGTACSRSSARRSASSFRAACFSRCREWLTDEQFFSFGWRIPFLASAVLVLVGLYVRLTITETPVFQDAVTAQRAREGPDVRGLPALPGHAGRRDDVVAGDVRALLPDDGLRAVVGHERARLQPRAVPADAARSASCSSR